MSEYQELKDWLNRNNHILKDRTPDDVADLAIASGQSRLAVAQWRTRFKFNDAVFKEII